MNVHVIIGEDDFLVSETAQKLIGGASGTALEVIDSVNSTNAELQLTDLREAEASYRTPPFLDPVKVTWWKNVHFLPQAGGKGPSEEVKARLEDFAAFLAAHPLPDSQRFILSGPKLLATSVFAKRLKGVAELAVFAAGKPWEQARAAVVRVIDWAAEMNLKFDRGVAEAFVARVGTDTRSLKGELGKMRDYLGADRHTITAADVAEVTSPGIGVEPTVWEVTDALGERNVEKVVAAVRRFEEESGFAVFMTTVVEKFFRQLVVLKDAEARGAFAAATEGLAPFAVRKNQAFLRNWTLRELRIARARFLQLRERCVSSAGSADVLVLTELIRTCTGR